MELQDLVRRRSEQVIEDATGRPVVGLTSGDQQEPDLLCEVFILGPTGILDTADRPVGP